MRALVEQAWDDEDAAALLCGRLAEDGALEAADAAAEAEIASARGELAGLPATEDRALLDTIAAFVLERTW